MPGRVEAALPCALCQIDRLPLFTVKCTCKASLPDPGSWSSFVTHDVLLTFHPRGSTALGSY